MIFADLLPSALSACFVVKDYDLDATLTSGQVFRWQSIGGGWEGVIGRRWVRLKSQPGVIEAETAAAVEDWRWLEDYLQPRLDLAPVLASFPTDEPMRAAVAACRGLRLLRQDPWECLASFILSSTKQIVQIQRVIQRLCQQFGDPISPPAPRAPAYTFPTPARLAAAREADLRSCQMGFRAGYLRSAARLIAEGAFDWERPATLPLAAARALLMQLPGVGPKIADCVLLFAYGRHEAFPIDVWVGRILRESYFRGEPVPLRELHVFARSHFGPWAGYAQQYLFHYARLHPCFPGSFERGLA